MFHLLNEIKSFYSDYFSQTSMINNLTCVSNNIFIEILSILSGVIKMTTYGGLLLSVFIASSMSGWSGCLHRSGSWQTGVCSYIMA